MSHCPTINIPPGYLNQRQTCDLLGIAETTLRKLIKSGRLQTSQLPGHGSREFVERKILDRFARRMGIELREADE